MIWTWQWLSNKQFGFRHLPIYLCYKLDCNAYAKAYKNFILLILLNFYLNERREKRQVLKRQKESGKAFPLG